jgi:hypothetical protein
MSVQLLRVLVSQQKIVARIPASEPGKSLRQIKVNPAFAMSSRNFLSRIIALLVV